MAVDTANKRSSAINTASAVPYIFPFPDNSISRFDRRHLVFVYPVFGENFFGLGGIYCVQVENRFWDILEENRALLVAAETRTFNIENNQC